MRVKGEGCQHAYTPSSSSARPPQHTWAALAHSQSTRPGVVGGRKGRGEEGRGGERGEGEGRGEEERGEERWGGEGERRGGER